MIRQSRKLIQLIEKKKKINTMSSQFKKYHKKFFRNVQIVYEFLEKTGMQNSLNALIEESCINYLSYYGNHYLDMYGNTELSEEEEEQEDNDLSENSKDDETDLDEDFLTKTLHSMNDSVLSMAVDHFEDMLSKRKEQEEQKEIDLEDSKEITEIEEDVNLHNGEKNKEIYSMLDNDSYEKKTFDEIFEKLRRYMEEKEIKEKREEVTDTTYVEFIEDPMINGLPNGKDFNLKPSLHKVETPSMYKEKEKRKYTENKDIDEWDEFFTQEREICKKLKTNYTSIINDYSKESFINSNNSKTLCIRYINIYDEFVNDAKKESFDDHILLYKRIFPISLVTGTSDNYIKLIFLLFEKKHENNLEECMHMSEDIEVSLLSSPIMYIDINYKNELCIVSTMNGEIYLFSINLIYIKELLQPLRYMESIESALNHIKKKNTEESRSMLSILHIYKDHIRYSLKCSFNDDCSLFASIGNDKNLNIYEYQEKPENSDTACYEKVKTIGLPEVPTCFLWVQDSSKEKKEFNEKEKLQNGIHKKTSSLKKEYIVVSMLNSNHILFLNSKNYIVEDKIYLFQENEKYNLLYISYNKKKHIIVVCTDTSKIFVYSLKKRKIIKEIYGCVLSSFSFPTMELNTQGNNIYVTSDDKVHGTYILIFDIKSGNIINKINNEFKIRCFSLFDYHITSMENEETLDNIIDQNKKIFLFLGSFDKKIHFYSN